MQPAQAPGVLVLNLTGDKNQTGSSEGYSIEIKNNQVVINAASRGRSCFMDALHFITVVAVTHMRNK